MLRKHFSFLFLFKLLTCILTIKQNSKEIELTIDSNIDGEKLFLETFKISNNFRFKTRGKNLIITLKLQELEKHFIYYLIDLLFVIEKAKKS